MDEMPTRDTNSLREYIDSVNIAENIDEDKLKDIGIDASEGFEYDLQTREHWEKNIDEWTKQALQVKEDKTFPWVGASNVKYPLLSTAAMQFNARAYPSLIPATGKVIKCEVIGEDPDGSKVEQADRVSKFMSYQLLNEMEGWEEDMDKLLMMLPIIGTLFKKTYYDSVLKHNVSDLILPKNIVVNYWAKSLDSAERISEVIRLNKRQLKERQLSKLFLDHDLGDPDVKNPGEITNMQVAIKQDNTLPYEFIEQHTYIDLDDDGYAEPYIVTFERMSKKVFRIVARYDEESIYTDEEGNLQKIVPIQYYTKFPFISNPDGGFYDIGFGTLLNPLNEAINTLLNQLVDAGTLNNLQGGILGKGLKLKMGEQRFTPGEWKSAQTTVDDIRKQILPLSQFTKEPSNVLLELMNILVTSGKELASVAEIFVGKMPGQNTPATTTMATIEQGMKVFTAVYKRIYRALKEEYKKLYKLNSVYLDVTKYQNVLDTQVTLDDFSMETYNICPNADPASPTQTEKLMKAQALLELLPIAPGMLDPVEVIKRVLDAQEQPAMERLFSQQVQQSGQYQPPPDPKMMEMQLKSQGEQQKTQLKVAETQQKMELNARDKMQQMQMRSQEHAQEMEQKRETAVLDGQIQLHNQRIFSAAEQMKNAQTMQQNDQKHQQTMQQTKEKQQLAKRQQTVTSSKTGKRTQ